MRVLVEIGTALPAACAHLPELFRRIGWKAEGRHRSGLALRWMDIQDLPPAEILPASLIAPAVILVHAQLRSQAGRREAAAAALTLLAWEAEANDPAFLWPYAAGNPVPAEIDEAFLESLDSLPQRRRALLLAQRVRCSGPPLSWDAQRCGRPLVPPASGADLDGVLSDMIPPYLCGDAQYWVRLAERIQMAQQSAQPLPPLFDPHEFSAARSRCPIPRELPLPARRLLKLWHDPRGYLLDSRWSLLRRLGRL